jgi:hypothetical protein
MISITTLSNYSGFQMRETSRLFKLKLELSTPGIKR